MKFSLLALGLSAFGVPASPPEPRPLVFVVDGAGDLKGCSNALNAANMRDGAPFEVSVFPWSHGYRRYLLDQIDYKHAREQGAKLAVKIAECRQAEPTRRMVLVAHSAGCGVALAACCALPANALDRVVLLAPSVSSGYDIRPALRAASEGFDVFCSKKDWVTLGVAVKLVRTADTLASGAAAGRLGFQPKRKNSLPMDEALRLRHHFWSPEMAWTGHTGGHHGMHQPLFVKNYLFPMLLSPEKTIVPAGGP